jgi:hypothetical protein
MRPADGGEGAIRCCWSWPSDFLFLAPQPAHCITRCGRKFSGSRLDNALHSRKHDHEVQAYAFDILAMGGDDLRSLPLHVRKAISSSCWHVGRTASQWRLFERGEIGPDLFAC